MGGIPSLGVLHSFPNFQFRIEAHILITRENLQREGVWHIVTVW